MADRHHRAGAGAVVLAADEGRRQPAFAFQADAGIGQQAVIEGGIVGQCVEQAGELLRIHRSGRILHAVRIDPVRQASTQPRRLRPRRIQFGVGQHVHARLDGGQARLRLAAHPDAVVRIDQQQVEWPIAGGHRQQ